MPLMGSVMLAVPSSHSPPLRPCAYWSAAYAPSVSHDYTDSSCPGPHQWHTTACHPSGTRHRLAMPHTETAFTYDLCPTAQASTGDAWAHSEQEPTDLRLGELLEHFVRPFPVLLSPPVCQPANKLQNTHLTESQESSSCRLVGVE